MKIHISVKPEVLFQLGPVAVTNSMFTMFIVMGLLLLVFGLIAKNAKPVPGKAQGIFELIAEFLLDLVEGTGGKKIGRQVFPLVGAIFIFIAFANYTGILPGVGTIYIKKAPEAGVVHEGEAVPAEGEGAALELASLGQDTIVTAPITAGGEAAAEGHEEEHLPLFRPPNADINMTLAMAVLTFTLVQVAGIKAHGVGGRLKHMADPVFLFPIEVIGEFSRIISLSARLFGNVFAGEVLLGVIYAMVGALKIAVLPLFLPVVFIGLELLFGTIQALVFALLTLIYITLASASHSDHGHEEAHDVAHHPKAPGAHASAGAGD
jgi:F-type H+-transporting ATPase subunit a